VVVDSYFDDSGCLYKLYLGKLLLLVGLYHCRLLCTQVSVAADGPARRTARYTKEDAQCDKLATVVGRTKLTTLRRSTCCGEIEIFEVRGLRQSSTGK